MTRRRWLLLSLLLISLVVAGVFVFIRERRPEPDGSILFTHDAFTLSAAYWLDATTGLLEPFVPPKLIINGPQRSPDGTEMVYSGFPGLYIYRLADRSTRQITYGDRESNPQWSPDGAYIIFTKNENYFSALFRYEMATGEILQLTNFQNELDAQWSPDGSRIVFTTSRDGFQEIYTMNLDGSELQRMTHNEWINDLQPKYSPDGRHIVHTTNYSVDGSSGEIWVMDADGTNHRQITHNDFYDSLPEWSPNGRLIAYVQSSPDTGVNIFIFDFQTGEIRSLTDNLEYYHYNFLWSPDSEWLAFIAHDKQGSDGAVYLIRPDGSDIRQLTEKYRYPRLHLWMPVSGS